jgi:Flp pilus assembly protein TadG
MLPKGRKRFAGPRAACIRVDDRNVTGSAGREGMRRKPNRGAAAVECAVCLPLLVTIVFGAIEACSMIFVQQSLQTVAYETARRAASPLVDNATAEAYGNQLLTQRKVNSGSVTVAGETVAGYSQLELVTVTASAPIAANRMLPNWFLGASNLTARCTMLNELSL